MLVARRRPTRQQVARAASVPAPTGGLNARDSIADMPPTDAVTMVNWFPGPTNIAVRNGSKTWASGFPTWVDTVMVYAGPTVRRLFGASGSGIYDASSTGAVGAAAVTGLTSSRWQWCNFGTPGGHYLVAVNGADLMRVFDGTYWHTVGDGTGATVVSATISGTTVTITTSTPHGLAPNATVTTEGFTASQYNGTWTVTATPSDVTFTFTVVTPPAGAATVQGTYTYAPSITGIATSSLVALTPFKQRLIFVEKDSLRWWYLPVTQLGGVAQSFDLASLCALGGYLMAACAWNMDTSSGPQDYCAFITSEGEVIVYQGYEPSIPGAWSLVGHFRVGRPTGRRCWEKVGSDIYVLSADGLFPLSQALLTDRSQDNKAVSNKITNLLNADAQAYGSNFGWQVVLHPIGNKVLVNVPQIEDTLQYQYVMNTITGAWTKFTGWGAACWALMGDQLFYGGNGVIVQADVGVNDGGRPIRTDLQPAFNAFGAPAQQKFWTAVRPIFSAMQSFAASATLNVDFGALPATSQMAFSSAAVLPLWNVTPWNSARWGGVSLPYTALQTVGGVGRYASLRMSTTTQSTGLVLQSIDYLFQPGGVL